MLQTIDLRFCNYIDDQCLLAIAQNCNPFNLKQLLLDGCELIDDTGLLCLTEKFPCISNSFDGIAYFDNMEFPSDMCGGGRGLEKLSIAECRKVTDQGLISIRKLKRLKSLNIQGCFSVSDEGIGGLLRKCSEIERLNLSGTYVSREGLQVIAQKCAKLKSIKLNGCRLLAPSDSEVLPHVKVEIREDVFRFQLSPAINSKLENITTNILRTRSSLVVQRISHYVCKKLNREDLKIDVIYNQILCNGIVLSPHKTLRQIQQEIGMNQMLHLQYRLHEETLQMEQALQQYDWISRVPNWVPDEEAEDCMRCEKPFSILRRRHHCRNCGKVICSNCSKERRYVIAIGHTRNPVRVCSLCADVLKKD